MASNDFDMKTRNDDLVARFRPTNLSLMEKAPSAPSHSTFVSVPNNGNPSSHSIASGMGPPTTKPPGARHLTEAAHA